MQVKIIRDIGDQVGYPFKLRFWKGLLVQNGPPKDLHGTIFKNKTIYLKKLFVLQRKMNNGTVVSFCARMYSTWIRN